MGLLPGERFCLMDDELLFHYLKPMVNGQMVPGKDSLFCESDLYGNLEPWQIWQEFESRHVNDLRKNKDMNNDELPKRKRNQEEEGLEEQSVEGSAGDNHLSSDALVVEEEPQEKRQRLQAPAVTAPFFNGADLEQWYLNQQVMEPIPPLIEAEQEAGPTPLEDEPAVALQGSENFTVQQPATELQQREHSQITTEPQQREENLTQQCHDMPTFVANETMTQGEVDVYDASLGDVMVGEDWREGLLNDEQLNSLYLGDWNDDALDFSDFKW
ncbi:hypothetical protein ACLB2K_052950 [Fragaria x ananassa]